MTLDQIIEKRREWLLDYVYCCEPEDLTTEEKASLDKRLDDEKDVIQWFLENI